MQSLLPNYVNYINKAQNSFKIMQEATVLIFVMNTIHYLKNIENS